MQAGQLRKRVTIQQRSQTQDEYGQPLLTWSDVATVYAAIEPMNGRELIAAEAVNSDVTHNVTMRYRAGITAAMRLNYQGRLFNIHTILDENERHRMLTLICSEGMNDG
jgi:SPP1 family predicted phage head-tail adaptor